MRDLRQGRTVDKQRQLQPDSNKSQRCGIGSARKADKEQPEPPPPAGLGCVGASPGRREVAQPQPRADEPSAPGTAPAPLPAAPDDGARATLAARAPPARARAPRPGPRWSRARAARREPSWPSRAAAAVGAGKRLPPGHAVATRRPPGPRPRPPCPPGPSRLRRRGLGTSGRYELRAARDGHRTAPSRACKSSAGRGNAVPMVQGKGRAGAGVTGREGGGRARGTAGRVPIAFGASAAAWPRCLALRAARPASPVPAARPSKCTCVEEAVGRDPGGQRGPAERQRHPSCQGTSTLPRSWA